MDHAMFELAMPWWEFVLRAFAVYVALLAMVRVTGKRSVSQTTPFDMVLIVLLGTAVQNSLIGEDISLLGGLILAATLIAMNYLVGWVTARWRTAHSVAEGDPVLLARNGEVFARVLRRQNLSRADFDEAMRRNGLRDDAEIECAWLEADGSVSLLKRRDVHA